MESIAIMQEQPFKFAERPSPNPSLANRFNKVDVVTNFIIVNFNQVSKKVWEYYINFKDYVFNEDDQKKNAIRKLLPELKKLFKPLKISGNNFFSLTYEQNEIEIKVPIGDIEATAIIRNSGHFIDLSRVEPTNQFTQDVKSFFEKVIKDIITANEKMIRFKNNYFSLKSTTNVGSKSFLMHGFSTSIRNTDSGLLLLVNIKNKFINGMNCLEKLTQMRNELGSGNEFIKEADKYFKDLVIMTTYGTPRTYTVSKICFDYKITNKTIKIRNTGEEITLKTYYETNYQNVNIKNKDQPLFAVETKQADGTIQEIYLIPELCYLTGMDDNSSELRAQMTSRTKLRPEDKMNKIKEFFKLIESKEAKKRKVKGKDGEIHCETPQSIKENWGLSFEGFKNMKAKVIPPPNLEFAHGTQGIAEGKIKYNEIIDKDEFHLKRDVWKIIVQKKNEGSANQIYNSFTRCCGRMGIQVDRPEIEILQSRSTDGFISELKNMRLNSNLKILLFILDRSSESAYKHIKNYINSEVGTPSQVVKVENLSKNLSYFTNVLNQMITKMGGRLFKINFMKNLYAMPTVFIGIQVEKIGSASRKVVITCTYDRSYAKYYTNEAVCPKDDSAETNTIIKLIEKAFSYFHEKHKTYPQMGFIYRSGVSAEEKKFVYQNEILCLDTFFESLRNNFNYVYTVVNKKNDIKFFVNDNGHLNNPRDGTVLDDGVTTYGSYEFYLQNQFVNQGCATPTHYHVLKCSLKIPMEAFQEITYHMSYYYWNWSGPTRLPACLKFAETYSKFIGTTSGNTGVDVVQKLRDKPYYI